MNRTLKFRIVYGVENKKQIIFLDLEKDLIDLKKYEKPIINQFAGQTDDYGNEIYEGDILAIVGNNLSKFKVLYQEDAFMVESDKSAYSFIDKTSLKQFLSIEKETMKKKVIGNIFENEK